MRKLIVTLALVTSALNASAQGKGKGKGKASQSYATGTQTSAVFDAASRRRIADWVQLQPLTNLPPGLRKGGLPPGLQKQLQRNGQLPPGLQKKMTPFPVELVRQLPPPPPACNYLFLDGQALVVNRGTNVIIDIMAVF